MILRVLQVCVKVQTIYCLCQMETVNHCNVNLGATFQRTLSTMFLKFSKVWEFYKPDLWSFLAQRGASNPFIWKWKRSTIYSGYLFGGALYGCMTVSFVSGEIKCVYKVTLQIHSKCSGNCNMKCNNMKCNNKWIIYK